MTRINNGSAMSDASLAHTVFALMEYDDPLFLKLKGLLSTGRRSEAMKLICDYDQRFAVPQAQELVLLVMNTLRDTIIDF